MKLRTKRLRTDKLKYDSAPVNKIVFCRNAWANWRSRWRSWMLSFFGSPSDYDMRHSICERAAVEVQGHLATWKRWRAL